LYTMSVHYMLGVVCAASRLLFYTSATLIFFAEFYCGITTVLWIRDGSVVSVHLPAASMGSSVRFLYPLSVGRSGAQVRRESSGRN